MFMYYMVLAALVAIDLQMSIGKWCFNPLPAGLFSYAPAGGGGQFPEYEMVWINPLDS